MRVQGSLRVVLNTMIWPNMLVERSSKRSVRISAVDADDGIKIYLIQVSHTLNVCILHVYVFATVPVHVQGVYNSWKSWKSTGI